MEKDVLTMDQEDLQTKTDIELAALAAEMMGYTKLNETVYREDTGILQVLDAASIERGCEDSVVLWQPAVDANQAIMVARKTGRTWSLSQHSTDEYSAGFHFRGPLDAHCHRQPGRALTIAALLAWEHLKC
jgi:hypothetical protein